MKSSTLHSLITARVLHNEAKNLIETNDRHLCSAALLLFQDTLEIIFLALLNEMGIDEKKNLDNKSFDELIGELKSAGIQIPKIGTLKALNKQRVITKHYGQLADPLTVRHYADAVDIALEKVVPQVIKKKLIEVFLTDLLEEEAKSFLNSAVTLIEKGKYLDALIEIRKAIFVEIEHEYDIHECLKRPKNMGIGFLSFMYGGWKAPPWTRNKEWIDEHVKDPIDYVQVDHERLRLDAMEWGVNTAELENIRRLTPAVFQSEKGAPWNTKYDVDFPNNEATEMNAKYCLDRAVSILLRKQKHTKTRRWPQKKVPFDPPSIYIGDSVFSKADQKSKAVHEIQEGFKYTFEKTVNGFDPKEQYYFISGAKPDPEKMFGRYFISGYLLIRE